MSGSDGQPVTVGSFFEDYARRKAMSVEECERWLGPNLDYDPEPPGATSSTA